MTYYNAGNVGIGTGSPGAPLHVQTTSANSLFYNPALYARTTSSVDFFTVGVQGESSGASGRGVFGRATSTSGFTYGVHGESASSSGRGVVGSATASSGTTYGVKGEVSSPDGYAGHFTGGRSYFGEKVGIGTTSPDSRLHVVHDSSSDSAIHGESSGAGSGVSGHNTQTSGIRSGVFGRSDASAGRGVQGLATASSGNNAGVFGQSNSSNGGSGVRGFNSSSSGTNYGVLGETNSSSGFDFYAAGAGTNYGSSSSRRWKSNIRNIDDPLVKIGKLRGVYYDWDAEHGGHHDVGMIAEEVGEVLPEIVQYEENGIDAIGMDYSKMSPLLVEAINALRDEKDAEIQALHQRVDQLEGLLEDAIRATEERR